jgi:hypothetical protein
MLTEQEYRQHGADDVYILTEPLAPFPTIHRLLPPSMATDNGPARFKDLQWTHPPDTPPLITL